MLDQLQSAKKQRFPPLNWNEDRNRAIYGYFKKSGESGVDGVLLHLADYLTEQGIDIVPEEWGVMLDEIASPMLDAFFRRYQVVIAPPALLTGNDLMTTFGIPAGPQIGKLLAALIEEQAAGTIHTKKEALRFAKRFLNASS